MPGERTIGSRCCVAACLNYQLTSSGVVFHKFPRDSARLIVWTDIVRRWNSGKPWTPNSRTMICSDHFLPECYQRDLRLLCDAGFSTKYARLKPNAVPSILDRGSSVTADGLTPEAVSPYLVPRSSPPQTADGSCVKRRRTGSGDHCSSSTASKDSGLPMVTTWDDDSEAPTYESSLDAPVAREEPVGQNQANAACLSQLVDEAIAASTATDVASSVLDPDPDPHPVGSESPDQVWGQTPVDICGLSPEAAQGPKEVSISVQTEGVQACTQSVQTKVKARSVGTQTTFAYQQRSVN